MRIDVPEVAVMSINVATEIASVGVVVMPDDHLVAIDVLMIPNIGDTPFTGESRCRTTGQNRQTRNQSTDFHGLTPDKRRLQLPGIDGRATGPTAYSFAWDVSPHTRKTAAAVGGEFQ
jgi:hypothetical protein